MLISQMMGSLRPNRSHNSSKNWNLRVSNEPCVDEKYCRRCELARKRIKDFSDTYGECRDSEQTPCVCEPVGMDHCVPTESTAVRKTVIYRSKDSVSERRVT